MHVDIVDNKWGECVQRRVETLSVEEAERRGELGRNGSYRFTTEPHALADCPFRAGDDVPMKWVDVDLERGFVLES